MPILEMRNETNGDERERGMGQRTASGMERFRSGGGAPEVFDGLFQAALRVPVLILCGAPESRIKNPAHGFHLGGRYHDDG